MRTVSFYSIDGVSKAKTAKAILVSRQDGKEAWIPLSTASVKFVGRDYKVHVSVPDWLYSKIAWKQPVPYVKKAQPVQPVVQKQIQKNPYIGTDYGNMMEERMVLEEQLSHEEYEYGMYQDSDDEPTLAEMAKNIENLKQRLRWIDDAANYENPEYNAETV